MTSNYFVNPYNFVSLGNHCDRKERETGNLTGKITCTLTTLTPMFIPNDKDSTDFYHYPVRDETINSDLFRPVIPGSEIRGALRSVFEAAYNCCLSQINTKPFHRRSMDVKIPGLLYRENGEWMLEECERVMLNTTFPEGHKKKKHGKYINKSEIETGTEIYIEFPDEYEKYTKDGRRISMPNVVADYSFKEKKGYTRGIVYIGEPFGKKKHHESVFVPLENRKVKKIEDNQIDGLKKVIELYHENSKEGEDKPYENYVRKLDRATKNRRIPVYYSRISGREIGHLAPAIFSQEVFERTLESILEEQGNYTPCSCKSNICLACHLFGFVKGEKMQASRIRFGDAVSNNAIKRSEIITLPVLGIPKPGAVEFYTKKIKMEKYWTYDYVKNGKKRTKLPLESLEIRGRKFYWHHEPNKDDWKLGINPNMEVKVEPIAAGNNFTFELYFERLTKDELDHLCNVLDINHSDEHAHKVGRAKPLGLGSVKIKIDKIQIRDLDRQTGKYDLINKAREEYYKFQIRQNHELLEILRFEPELHGKSVSYPKVQVEGSNVKANDEASHQWFNKNSSNKKHFKKHLPTIEEEISNDGKLRKRWLTVTSTKK